MRLRGRSVPPPEPVGTSKTTEQEEPTRGANSRKHCFLIFPIGVPSGHNVNAVPPESARE